MKLGLDGFNEATFIIDADDNRIACSKRTNHTLQKQHEIDDKKSFNIAENAQKTTS